MNKSIINKYKKALKDLKEVKHKTSTVDPFLIEINGLLSNIENALTYALESAITDYEEGVYDGDGNLLNPQRR